ncbi:MAG: septum formation family protein [Actinomycetota bacterium]|nr:septum formation family protein [Actinomycetota bacterium]
MNTALAQAEPAAAGPAETGTAETGMADAGPVAEETGAGAQDLPAIAELAGAVAAEQEPAGEEPAPADLKPDEAEPARDVSPLAILGIVVGVILLVGVAAGALAVLTHGFHKKIVVTYRTAAVFKLRPGECINSGPNGLAVTVLSCRTPHDAEVFATFTLPASSWPGNAIVQQNAGDGCASRLSSYLRPALAGAGLAQEYVYPNQAAWQASQRTVVCEVSSSTGKLTGSVRQGS